MQPIPFFDALDTLDNPKPCFVPRVVALRPQVGAPRAPVQEQGAYLQGFRTGLVLWRPDHLDRLVLHTDGRLGYQAANTLNLGEPLAPATWLQLRWQRCERGTLLWTAPTGWLALFAQRWALPLEAVA